MDENTETETETVEPEADVEIEDDDAAPRATVLRRMAAALEDLADELVRELADVGTDISVAVTHARKSARAIRSAAEREKTRAARR